MLPFVPLVSPKPGERRHEASEIKIAVPGAYQGRESS